MLARVTTSIALALIVLGAPALAAEEQPAKEKKICREDLETGSIIPKRICHTKDEWAQIDQATQLQTDQALQERQKMRPH